MTNVLDNQDVVAVDFIFVGHDKLSPADLGAKYSALGDIFNSVTGATGGVSVVGMRGNCMSLRLESDNRPLLSAFFLSLSELIDAHINGKGSVPERTATAIDTLSFGGAKFSFNGHMGDAPMEDGVEAVNRAVEAMDETLREHNMMPESHDAPALSMEPRRDGESVH